ncbi:hypothetical protein GN956_G20391 [Arapaima gigas]
MRVKTAALTTLHEVKEQKIIKSKPNNCLKRADVHQPSLRFLWLLGEDKLKHEWISDARGSVREMSRAIPGNTWADCRSGVPGRGPGQGMASEQKDRTKECATVRFADRRFWPPRFCDVRR